MPSQGKSLRLIAICINRQVSNISRQYSDLHRGNGCNGGQKRRDIKKKYELVVINTARRTLATQMVGHSLLYEQVMKITGHKKHLHYRNI